MNTEELIAAMADPETVERARIEAIDIARSSDVAFRVATNDFNNSVQHLQHMQAAFIAHTRAVGSTVPTGDHLAQ